MIWSLLIIAAIGLALGFAFAMFLSDLQQLQEIRRNRRGRR